MKKFILKNSQLLGLKTFTWEVKLHTYAILGYPTRWLAYIVGFINNRQMELDKFLRFVIFKDNTEG